MAGNKTSGDDDFGTDFDFDVMPTPGSPPPAASGGEDYFGDPETGSDLPAPGVSEFDDVRDDFGVSEEDRGDRQVAPINASADDFDTGFDMGGDDPADAGEGAFDNAEFGVDGEDGSEIETEEEPGEYAEDNRSFLSRFGMPIGIGVVLLAVGTFGYIFLLPFLGINMTPQTEAPVFTASPVKPPAATALGGDLPLAQPTSTTPNLPAAPSLPAKDIQTLPGSPGPALPGLTGSMVANTVEEQAPTPQPVGLPSLPSTSAAPETAAVAEIEDLRELVADLREQIEAQEVRLAELESRPREPVVPQPVVTPPEKPLVIEGWSLKGVTNGVGWIDGPGGFLEVRAGTVIPNVGKVTDVTRYEDQWLVVTDAGIIVE